MTRALHLSVTQRGYPGGRRRITRLTPDDGGPALEVFHESEHLPELNDSTLLDGHVLGMLLHAMSEASTLIVEGAVSLGMMRNLEELQRAWARWRPEHYRIVEIRADKVVNAREARKSRAVAAFSGGVDATFTALDHVHPLPGSHPYPLTHLLMVHGFDVGVDRPYDFDRLVKRVMPFVDELGLELWTIKTDAKARKRGIWEDTHMVELAGCMQMFAGEFAHGLVGSTESYEALVIPWGSSPVTDHLMSGDGMEIVHHGAGYSRTEKIDFIADHPTACHALKVCWEGQNQAENCGACEKCVRTKLNFLTAGRPVPSCFATGVDVKDILGLKIYNEVQRGELRTILKTARSRSITDPWVGALRRRVRRPLTPTGAGFVRQFVYPAVERLGLKPTLKQARAWIHANLGGSRAASPFPTPVARPTH